LPRNGSGTYSLPAGNPVVTGTVISSTVQNNTTSDIATALTNSIAKDGQTTPTANLPMGGFKLTGLGAGSVATDSAHLGQIQAQAYIYLGSVAGTNTITATTSPVTTAYASGQTYRFVAAGANTGAVTININSLGAKDVTKNGTAALISGDIISGAIYTLVYDGTRFQVFGMLGNLALTGNLSVAGASVGFNGASTRITADFTNATISTRAHLQTSTADGATRIGVLPNGTSTVSEFVAYNNADPTNAQSVNFTVTSTEARIQSTAFGTGTGSYLPLQFYTSGNKRAELDTTGNLRLNSTGGAIGYATGAGGTVTQATSKSTGVTLSRPTGQITMNNALLGNDTTVSFTLTNTVIAAGDILVMNHISGGTGGSYTLNAQCGAGSAVINVRNVTAGNLSEAIVIAFAVVRAVTS
jgi:hypothetical protein